MECNLKYFVTDIYQAVTIITCFESKYRFFKQEFFLKSTAWTVSLLVVCHWVCHNSFVMFIPSQWVVHLCVHLMNEARLTFFNSWKWTLNWRSSRTDKTFQDSQGLWWILYQLGTSWGTLFVICMANLARNFNSLNWKNLYQWARKMRS